MTDTHVQPSGPLSGTVRAPPSKSVTHRAFLLAALSSSPASVQGPLMSADTRSTLACLHALGAQVDIQPTQIRFTPAPLRAPREALPCGNSGTTLRLMAATCARLAVPASLTGDASLRRRPNGPLVDALHALGARVRSAGGRAPLHVQGPIHCGTVELPRQVSSQFASSLMLALPLVAGPSQILLRSPVASRPYLDVTRRVAEAAGLRLGMEDVDGGALRIDIPGGQVPTLSSLEVEGDWSAAAFPLAAAAMTGGEVTVEGLNGDSAQGDRAVVTLLQAFGCDVQQRQGSVTVKGQALQSPGTVDVGATPDLFPVLAVLAAASRGTTTLLGGSQLRVKESDRIAAMAQGLSRMGIRNETLPDGLVVQGGTLRGAHVQSGGDHRIHMAFAVAALAAEGASAVDGAASAAVSYPSFHADMARLGARFATFPAAAVAP